MNRRQTLATALVLLGSLSPALADEPKAEGPPDYKLVYWFDWAKPIQTFHHKAYDVKAGGYPSEAVQAWKASLRQSHPRYAVLIRDAWLSELPGDSVDAKLKEAVHRQYIEVVQIAAVPGPSSSLGPPVSSEFSGHRQTLRPTWRGTEGPEIPRLYTPINQVYPAGRHPLGSAGFQPGPGSYPMPVPMPYPRPHP